MSFGIPIGEKDVFNAKTEEVWLNFILHIMDIIDVYCGLDFVCVLYTNCLQ